MSGFTSKAKKESPKTPGGISKSLLTPCRRVGLSRKWRKSGCSPFISPFNGQNATDTPEKMEPTVKQKRKKCDENERNTEANNETTKEHKKLPENNVDSPISSKISNERNITLTPCRNIEISRKKSKVLSLSLKESQDMEKDDLDKCKSNEINVVNVKTTGTTNNIELIDKPVLNEKEKPIRSYSEENVTKLVRTKSKSKNLSLKRSLSKSETKDVPTVQQCQSKLSATATPKEKSPNNLTKECIVVIQNKILNSNPLPTSNETETIHGSDSEPDVPLSSLKRENATVTLNTLDDNDFIDKPVKKKIRNLSLNKKNRIIDPPELYSSSQSSQEDIDKRTILIKKTYQKVVKPQKAKSTGSITQKDIDDLKARIEIKKKRLLAKAMSVDTEELRGLIKKWQKGCQDALMELLDLMKKKLPDRQNMDYAEMLEALKIPAQLVGFDSDNDCFITPDDNNVLLSAFKL